MSDVLNLLCDYAAAGAVVDRSLIAKVESEIARLTERLEAAEALLRAAVECGEWFDGTFHVEMNADWLDKAKEVCDEPL